MVENKEQIHFEYLKNINLPFLVSYDSFVSVAFLLSGCLPKSLFFNKTLFIFDDLFFI
jgi:hypothetical protein